ncbi:beta-propeller fold lactonase family protein [Pseudomonas silvicola]|nr:beta-propeller fold lactonase family protein [Pseudomonas silvicola]
MRIENLRRPDVAMCVRALATVLLSLALSPVQAASFVYVSNADDGDLSAFALDQQSGKLHPLGRAAAAPKVMSQAVSPDAKYLFASIRSEPFSVMSWRIEADGRLSPVARSPLPNSMAYLSVDRSGQYLLSASYGGDLVSVNHIAQGRVGDRPEQVIHTGKRAHAILVSPDNQFAYVSLLGADQMLEYRFDANTGQLTANGPGFVNVETEGVTGPRHFAIAPGLIAGRRYLYVVTEMAGTVDRFVVQQDGTLLAVDTVSSVPKGADMERGLPRPVVGGDDGLPPSIKPRIWQADIHLTPDGRFLYTSERTSSYLSLFKVDQASGALSYVESVPTEQQPRGFAIDSTGRFLICSGQKSTQITVYQIGPADGRLKALGQYAVGKGANWVSIVNR